MWVLFRNLIASLTLISSTVIVAGIALSWLYWSAPFARVSRFSAYFFASPVADPAYEGPFSYASLAVGLIAGVAGVLWVLSVFPGRGARRVLRQAGTHIFRVAGILSVFVFVLPLVFWATATVTKLAKGGQSFAPEAFGGGAFTIFITYIGALAAILWRRRVFISGSVKKLTGLFSKKAADETATRLVPRGLTQYLIVWGVLVVLVIVELLVLGVTGITGHDWDWRIQLAFPLGILFVHFWVDQTSMSLHPFYRRRVATAFAVRRTKLSAGDVVAAPYDFDREGTDLTSHCKKVEGFPQVIFACAANLSGPDRTPPGRRAVSYTMSHDYVGGPDVGYVDTETLENLVSETLKEDLTVQGAVAVSGAAFASAMGGSARTFQTLLALSNARLGSWLPNPVYLSEMAKESRWWMPGLPSRRRLTYLMREVIGQFPDDDRLLLVTDGGHYDNLGLVELLRHRCRTIFCIDASGDSPPFPETLTQAILLAKEELGIKIHFKHLLDLVPGSGKKLKPEETLKDLSARLSKSCVAIGDVEYPATFSVEGGPLRKDGKIFFAKALLTPDLSHELIAYANSETIFPRDGTGDQWFSHKQFDAYQQLGLHIGKKALDVYTKTQTPDLSRAMPLAT